MIIYYYARDRSYTARNLSHVLQFAGLQRCPRAHAHIRTPRLIPVPCASVFSCSPSRSLSLSLALFLSLSPSLAHAHTYIGGFRSLSLFASGEGNRRGGMRYRRVARARARATWRPIYIRAKPLITLLSDAWRNNVLRPRNRDTRSPGVLLNECLSLSLPLMGCRLLARWRTGKWKRERERKRELD